MLRDFLRKHNVQFHEGGGHRHVRSGWIGVDCPYCGPGSGKFHLGFELATGRCVCWKCGRFPPGKVLARITGASLPEAIEVVSGAGGGLRSPQRPETSQGRYRCPKGLQALTGPYRRYLQDRGLNPRVIEDIWGLRATGLRGPLSWRLWIPVELGGRPVTWTTRAIGEGVEPRYRAADPGDEDVPLKHTLYGADYAGPAVIVVEGMVDVWSIGPGAVGLFGTKYSPQQVALLGRYPVRTICLDGDAQKQGRRLASELEAMPGQTNLVELESGNDPNEAEESELMELRRRFL